MGISLDWGGGVGANAGPRLYTLTSPALPDADWCIGIWVRRNFFTGTTEENLWCIGTFETTDSMYLYMGRDAWVNGILGGHGINAAAVDLYNTAPGVTLPQNGKDYLVVLQRRSNNIESYCVEKGTTAVLQNFSTGISGTLGSHPMQIGRADGTDNNVNPLGELFIFNNRSLSLSEVTSLAVGRQASYIAAPLVLLPFRSGEVTTEPNLGSGGNTYDATISGSGFTTPPEFFPLADGSYQLTSDLYF